MNNRDILAPLRRFEAPWHLIPHHVWEWMDNRMRVDEKVRKSVVFLGAENERGFTPYGTGLLGVVIFEDMGNIALVTAAHLLKDIPGDTISVRVNRKDGSTAIHKLKKSWAITFNDKAIDLVAFPFGIDPLAHDIYMIPITSSSWEYQIAEYGEPGPGDEVCVVGLYTTHFGSVRNIPVVRVGHIAAMPEEKVMTDRGYVMGYLIECHSIAGLSGSPVYWNVPQLRMKDGQLQHIQNATYVPLGILIGYHVIESKEDEIPVPQFHQPPETRQYLEPRPRTDERRTGFGVVLPIQHIYEIFESEELQKIMGDNIGEARKKSGYRPASAIPTVDVSAPKSDANPTHREDFTSLLNAAVKSPARED
jgi:hypothetical protein